MMTGDSDRTAKVIAAKLVWMNIMLRYFQRIKLLFVEKEKAEGRKVIMIGDGINDSPDYLHLMLESRSVMELRLQEKSQM